MSSSWLGKEKKKKGDASLYTECFHYFIFPCFVYVSDRLDLGVRWAAGERGGRGH